MVWNFARIVIYLFVIVLNSSSVSVSKAVARPIFAYPQTLPDGYATEKYFGAVSANAQHGEFVMKIRAIDTRHVTYYINPSLANQPPFLVSPTDGTITTSHDFHPPNTSPRQFRFHVEAIDTDPNTGDIQSSRTEVIINLIEDFNRFVLVQQRRSEEVVAGKIELESSSKKIALIEQIVPKVTLVQKNGIQSQEDATDVVFVLVGNEDQYHYRLLNNTNSV